MSLNSSTDSETEVQRPGVKRSSTDFIWEGETSLKKRCSHAHIQKQEQYLHDYLQKTMQLNRGAQKAKTAHIWERKAALEERIYGRSEVEAMMQKHSSYAQRQMQLEQEFLQKMEYKDNSAVRKLVEEELAFARNMYLTMEHHDYYPTLEDFSTQKTEHTMKMLIMKRQEQKKIINATEKEIKRLENELKNFRSGVDSNAEMLVYED